MRILSVTIKATIVWLVIDQLRVYSSDTMNFTTKNKFLCYFKNSEPTPFIYGELFTDNNENPIMFDSEKSAIDYAYVELERRIK